MGLKLRFYLDLCSGLNAPFSVAALAEGLCTFCPVDAHPMQGGPAHALTEDEPYNTVARLVHSGVVAWAHGAPPCADHSLLRLRPGGPPRSQR